MIRFNKVLMWTVFILKHMAISMDTYSDKILEAEATLQEIQPTRQLFKESQDISNIFRPGTSAYPDPNAHPNPRKQQLGYGNEEVLYQREGYQKRLRDGTMMDGAFLSLGPPIEMGSPKRMMKNLEGSSKDEPRWGTPPSSRYRDLHSSIPRLSIHNHEDTAILVPNHRGLEQRESDKTREIALEITQGSPRNLFQIAHTSAPGSSHDSASQGAFNNQHGDRLLQGMPSISETRKDFELRAANIDIRNFDLHTPDKMLSAAAIHYTQDLIKTLSTRSPTATDAHMYPSWEVGKLIWTSERLLPFVYFILSCNPSIKVWEKIKRLTDLILRNYDRWSINNTNILNQEKHARFLLWHTEVMYHITLLEPVIRSSSASITIPKFSTLARTFWVINDDKAFRSFTTYSSSRPVLERHVAETFEEDYKAGYPMSEFNRNVDISTLTEWNKKSDEIRNMGDGIVWPRISNVERDQSEPVLLMNGYIQHDNIIKSDPKLSKFVNYWEKDLKNMIQSIKVSQPTNLALSNLSLIKICKGINAFVTGRIRYMKQRLNVDNRPIEYQVTIFTRFLHQDSNDENFKRFWDYFDHIA
ncbi:hypothetical protein DFH28DRAFT_1047916 [Melampsora americana]|nr:hypothetical protein DFH28DRAFT_1047916 [Melampsora americana]